MKLASLVIVLSLIIIPIGTVAHGQEESTNTTAEQRQQAIKEFRDQLIADKKQELSEARAQRIVTRCVALKARVALNTGKLLEVRDSRGGLINNLVTRLEAFSLRLQAAELDTAALDADIATLKTMAGELDTLWVTYAEKLDAVKTANCSENADALHEALEAAKSAGADVRTKFKEVKDFLKSDIKAELQHLREDLAGEQAE